MTSQVFRKIARQNKRRYLSSLPFIITNLLLALLCIGCAQTPGQSTELSGHIKVSGSTALLPLVTAASKTFQKLHPGTRIDVVGGGSKTGLQDVTNGKTAIGDSDIYADPALYPDPRITDHIVCVTPFVMIVNPDVTVTSVTRQQIIDIYNSGKYRNWNELGGPDMSIEPVVRPATSGTRDTFRKYILNGLDEVGKITLAVDDTKQVVNTVASTPGAIGYVALSAVTSKVKTLAIDNQTSTKDNISAGRYNFWSYEHMYTLGDDNPLVAAFLSYMTSTALQPLVQQLHYIPINEMNLPKVSLQNNGQANGSSSPLSMTQESEVTRRESF